MNYESIVKPYLDTKVDRIDRQDGQSDQVPKLTLDIPDRDIIKSLNNRIEDSAGYWREPKGFDLEVNRQKNMKLFLGKQIDEGQLYRFQIPYVENQIYKSVDSILAYVTSQPPTPEVYPSTDTDRAKTFALDIEKGLQALADKIDLRQEMENALFNLLIKRIGVLHFWFDPDIGSNGEICVKAINPDHLIIDKNVEQGENPAFICHLRKDSVEQLCYRFPDKTEDIFKELGVKRQTPKLMSQIIVWKQVWMTHYDKTGEPQEGCVSYFKNLVLSKYKDPNWIWSNPSENFLDCPMKPYIPMNLINDGQHWIDHTTVVEQAAWIQEVLNKRGRQIMENADTANGFMVLSSDAISVDDAENLTGDPNQKLVIDTNGMPIQNMIDNIEGRDLPSYVIEDKADLRTVIADLMGVPAQFAGNENNQSDTLGQAIMVKQQAAGRQDRLVRALDRSMGKAYNFMVQMMAVHYTDKHFVTLNGGDGEFDRIVLHRHMIDQGMQVHIKAGSTLPFDKSREEAITLNLSKEGLLAPIDVYKGLHMPNPQKLYDNWAKYKTDPMQLAQDALNQLDETDAYLEYIQILDGKKVKPKEDASIAHIMTHRKQMLNEDFLAKARKSKKVFDNMTALVQSEVTKLQISTDLDQMSQQGAEAIAPSSASTPPASPLGAQGGVPPMPPPPGPGGPPTAMGPMGGPPGGMAPPSIGMGGGGAPSVAQVMSGGGQAPGAQPAPTPSPASPTAMPMV
jgi:hypothetical protein